MRCPVPLRPFNREQAWLLPPSLDELVPQDHPARFVDMLLEGLDEEEWDELGVGLEGDPMGAPAYHPRALVGVWVYGFMDGVRSTRKLEKACRDQLPYAWLSCMERPDHNTLWRFYRSHRDRMRSLLALSVRMAVKMGLLDLAFQAVDGTKAQASASREGMLDEEGLLRLLARLDRAVHEMEEQNSADNGPPPARLPETLEGKEALRKRTLEALEQVRKEDGPEVASPTGPEARLLRSRGGHVAGYNAQAVASPLADGAGMLITAAEVPADPDDHQHLLSMVKLAEENTGQRAEATLADAGYHSGHNLALCKGRGIKALMPEANARLQEGPYHKSRFAYSADEDAYTCPHGQPLTFRGMQARPGKGYESRRYRAVPGVCRACPAFGECTKSRSGRAIYVTPNEGLLHAHRQLMEEPESKALYSKRKQTIEPVFGIIKEQMAGRRFLLRGIEGVRAEWSLLAAAFNLRSIFRVWSKGLAEEAQAATA